MTADEVDVHGFSDVDLFRLYADILAELRSRGIVRSANAPAGDYGELLVKRALGGELADKAEKSWDVKTLDGKRIQVKCRLVSNPKSLGQRQLSVFRTFDFDKFRRLDFVPDRLVNN